MCFILCILSIFDVFLVTSSYGKPFWSFVYDSIYCGGAGIITFMSISDGLEPYFFLSKDGKHAVDEKKNGWRDVYFPIFWNY